MATLSTTGLVTENFNGNIRNFVGTVEIPVGLAGPLLFRGEHATGPVTAPMATTEGVLVASTAEGPCHSPAGGVETRALLPANDPAPGFEFADLEAIVRFAERAIPPPSTIRRIVGEVSRHSHLLDSDPLQIGWPTDHAVGPGELGPTA